MNELEKLSPSEKEVFTNYRKNIELSGFKPKSILIHLKYNEMSYSKKRSKKWIYQAVAAMVFLAAGYFIGNRTKSIPPLIGGYDYMLVLHESPDGNNADSQQMFEEYSNWMKSIADKGIIIDGQELKEKSVSISNDREESNPKSVVSGFFVLKASSLEDVKEIVRSSPHVKYGGTVEIKEYMIR